MAITNDDLLVNVSVNTAEAAKSLEKLSKEFEDLKKVLGSMDKDVKKTADSVSGFGATMVKLSSTLNVAREAFNYLINPMKEMVGEFYAAQDAQQKLINVLRLTGDNVSSTVDEFNDYAEMLENTTTIEGDFAISLLTTAKTLGLSNEQAKEMVTTAGNLSAVTKNSVNESFNALMMTYKGNTKALGELSPLVKGLTKEQVEAGGAVKLLSQYFSGQAENATKTFSGSLQVLSNSLGNLKEEIGGIVAGILNLNETNSFISNSIKSFTAFIKDNKENIILYGKAVISVFDDIATGATALIADLIKPFSALLSLLPSDKLKEFHESVKLVGDGARKSFGDIGDSSLEQIKDQTVKVTDETQKYKKVLSSVSSEFTKTREEGTKALEELQKKISQLTEENIKTGASETQQVYQRLGASQKEIDALVEKIRLAGLLKGENEQLVRQAIAISQSTADKELATLRLKNLDELIAKNKELSLSIKQEDMDRLQIIDAQTELLIEQVNEKYKSLELDQSGKAALEEQIKLIKERGKLEKQKSGGQEMAAFEKVGKDAAEGLSGVFKEGVGGMIGGVASMFSMISAAVNAIAGIINAILDFIPKILDTVTNIFKKVTALPETILNSVKNLGESVKDFTKNFLPSLLKAIPEIISTLIDDFLFGINDALQKLMNDLPNAAIGFIDKMIANIPRFIEGIITNAPKIALILIDTLIKNAPRLYMAIIKGFYIEMPKAFYKGIIQGAKALADMIKAALTGKGFKVPLDTKSLVAGAKELGRKLSGEASKLFAVMDLQQAAQAADKAQDLANQIENGMKKAGNWLKKIWDDIIKALLTAWRYIYDKIIKPVVEALITAWRWVYDNVIKPFIDGITAVWRWIYENIITPLIEGVRAVWQFILDNIVNPLLEGLQLVWDFVLNEVVNPLIDGINSAWLWVKVNILEPLQGVGEKAFSWVKENIVTPLSTIGQSAFQWVKTSIVDPLQSIADIFKNFKMPAFSWPKLPAFSFPSLPSFSWPSLPKWSWPELPTLKIEVPEWLKNINLGGGGGGDGGGLLGGLFANGGLVKPLYAADGMFVPKGTDTVPAMLTPGEYVVNRQAVNSLGVGTMNQVNKGVLPSQTSNVTANITINTTKPVDESIFRQVIWPRVKEELKRSSLDGNFLISSSGVR
jgi:hypothetical protein